MPEPVQKMMAQTQTLMQALVETETLESEWLTAIAEGRAFTGGAKVSVGSNQTGAIRLENPADSGKLLMVFRFAFSSDMDGVDVLFVKNATISGGTAKTPFSMNFVESVPTVSDLQSGVDVLTGGDVLSPVLLLGAHIPFIMDLPVIVGPGTSLAAQLTIGALSSADFYGSVFWYEKDIEL